MVVAMDKAVSSAGPCWGDRSLAHRLVPAPHAPGTSTDTPDSARLGQLLVPFLPTTSIQNDTSSRGWPGDFSTKTGGKATIPAAPQSTV